MKKTIKLLDKETINKIAAGEIIERPSSVIKELVENSIDANASSIVIEILNGGKDYIRVTDDGMGINKNEIELAFMRHSTSKINKLEDLHKIKSLGFRGEALASISAVSKVQLITKPQDIISGTQVEIEGNKFIDISKVGCPKGTTIIIKDLFFNTPVRKKFLKSKNIESSYISAIVYNLALSFSNISFKYIKDYKQIFKTPGSGNTLDTVYSLFGKEFSKSLLKIDYMKPDISITGYIGKPSFNKGTRKQQHLFLNGRIIKSEILTKAIEKAYKTYIMINRHPVCILYIEVDPNTIDVNVHPTKTEIKFEDEEKIFNHIYEAVFNIINKNNLIPKMKLDNTKEDNDLIQDNFIDTVQENKENYSNNLQQKNEKIPIEIIDMTDTNTFINENNNEKNHLNKIDEQSININKDKKIKPQLQIIGLLFNTYILCQDTIKDDFYIIDQHAAHERILYEKFKYQFNNESIITQKLLSPEVINLTHSDLDIVTDNIDLFNKLGFELEGFGVNSIIIRSVPMVFGKPDLKELFSDILSNLHNNIENNYKLKLDRIIKMSCTNAIKAGDRIKLIEIEELINKLFECDNPYTCPHGRPTIIKLTKYEIERKFKRIQ